MCGWEEEGSPGSLGSLLATVGTAHLHGTLQSCLGLPVSGFLTPLGHLPPGAQGEGGQSVLKVGGTPDRLNH